MKRILICKRFTSVTHKQAKNYGAFARLITLASFLFPDPELGLCLQTRLLLGVPCAFVFEQSSSVFVALKVILFLVFLFLFLYSSVLLVLFVFILTSFNFVLINLPSVICNDSFSKHFLFSALDSRRKV